MLKLRDIMSSDLLTVSPEASLREAMDVLTRHHVSGAPVVNGTVLVGVITAGDIMAFAAAMPGVPVARDLEDDRDIWDAPGIDVDVEAGDEAPAAYFSDLWDDAGVDVSDRMATVNGPEWNALEAHDVSEAMTTQPLVAFPPDTPAEVAAARMEHDGIHRVLVTERGRLIGLVTALDIARAAGEGRLSRKTYVFNRDRDFGDAGRG